MRRWWLWLVILVVLAAFLPVLSNDFIEFDDNLWLVRNSLIQPPTFASFLALWHTPFLGLYVPVPMAVWHTLAHFARADTAGRLVALDPAWFHSASLTAHLLATAGVGLLARRLLKGNILAGTVAAAWYGLHPTQVEAVAWASGLKDVLSAMFSVWSLWALTGYFQRDRRRLAWLIGAVLMGWLAMLSKPAAVMLPAGWLIVWIWNGHLRPTRALAIASALLVAGSVAMAVITNNVQPVSEQSHNRTVAQRLEITGDTVGHYLIKAVWPMNLTLDYGRAPEWVLAEGRWIPRAGIAVASILAVVGIGLWGGMSGRRLALACGLALIPVVPVLGFKAFTFQEASTVTDHYMMPAHVGLGLVAALAVTTLAAWRPAVSRRGLLVVALVGAVFAVLTYEQATRWHDNESLFGYSARVSPNPTIVLNNLAATAKGLEPHEVVAMYRRAIANRPTYSQPWANISHILLGQGDVAGAIDAADKAIALDPLAYEFRKIRAEALLAAGRRDEAMADLRVALDRSPNFHEARRLLEKATTMPAATLPSAR